MSETDTDREKLIETLARMWAEVDPNRQPIDPDAPLRLSEGASLNGRPTWEWFIPRAEGSIAYLAERGFEVVAKNG